MPAQIDSTIGATRDSTVAALEQRLRTAVDSGSNSNGRHAGEAVGSNGAIQTPPARDVAIDVCRAILAEAGAGTAEHSDDVVLITEAIGERMGLSGAEAEDLLVAARRQRICWWRRGCTTSGRSGSRTGFSRRPARSPRRSGR